MGEDRRISLADARAIGDTLGADWGTVDPAEFRRGIEIERDAAAGRLALARLAAVPDYYTRLDELSAAAEKHLSRRFRL
jgi:hypothetical protein